LELRHLRYFIAVAEELNFRRAAERLHISQPPLSLQIKALEEEVGGALFERSKQHVALTPAGQVFLGHARHVLEEAVKARMSVKLAMNGEVGELRIGFTPSSEFLPFLPSTIQAFRGKYPGITLTLKEMTSAAQVTAIAERQLDLGVVRKPSGRLASAVHLAKLSTDRPLLAMHEDDALTRKSRIQVSDLRDLPLIGLSRQSGAGLHEFVTRVCWAAGFSPNIVQEVQEVSTMIALVAAGLGAAIIPAPLRRLQLDRVAYRPLVGKGTQMDLHVASHAKDKNTLVAEFKKMLAHETAKARDS
jgi:DNA-binding transcriptional LysR family regulator